MDRSRSDFERRRGHHVQMLDRADAHELVSGFIRSAGLRVDKQTPYRPDLLDLGGRYAYEAYSMASAVTICPELELLYRFALTHLQENVSSEIVASPYESRLTVKVYWPGDQQGWHYDTNPVSVLLALTDGVATEFIAGARAGRHWSMDCDAGMASVFPGRRYLHCAPPSTGLKVVVPMNFYYGDDLWRPAGVDDLILGGAHGQIQQQ